MPFLQRPKSAYRGLDKRRAAFVFESIEGDKLRTAVVLVEIALHKLCTAAVRREICVDTKNPGLVGREIDIDGRNTGVVRAPSTNFCPETGLRFTPIHSTSSDDGH